MQDPMHNRRHFLALVGAGAALLSVRCRADLPFSKPAANQLDAAKAPSDPASKSLAPAAALVKVKEKWTAEHLYEFLNALPNESLLSLKKALGLLNENANLNALQGKSKDVRDIQKQALWISSNILTYPFHDETVLNYHSLVMWVAKDIGVAPEIIANESTFVLERAAQKLLFAQVFVPTWDKLNVKEREDLLNKIDPKGQIKDKAAIAALSGSGALAALSTTVAFTGFAFYTTMSVTISTVAGFFGLTLPFAGYAGASSIIAFISGPVGWAVMGIGAVGGIALAGRANVKKTTDFIFRIHELKVAALSEAGIPEKEVFDQ